LLVLADKQTVVTADPLPPPRLVLLVLLLLFLVVRLDLLLPTLVEWEPPYPLRPLAPGLVLYGRLLRVRLLRVRLRQLQVLHLPSTNRVQQVLLRAQLVQ
jgi:hypothetical protein